MNTDGEQSKSEIRRRLRAALATLSDEHRREASRRACENLMRLDAVQAARTLMLYMPLGAEVDVTFVAQWLLDDGRTVCVPRVDWQRCEMEPVRLTSLDADALMPDQRGILVPKHVRPLPLESIDAILVPGLAFDRQGHRLGRGAGFYDRFLARLRPDATKIGVIFHEQLVDKVPVEDHDVHVDVVVTDRQTIP